MSRPNGITRGRRRRRPAAVTDSRVLRGTDINKSNESKQLSHIFSDFDFSDIDIDFNTCGNNSFKASKNCFKPESTQFSVIDNESKIESFSTKSLINNFNGINFDPDISHLSLKTDSIGFSSSKSFSKSLVTSCDVKPSTSKSFNTNKRKNASLVFDDIDLSDIPNESSVSRKSFKTDNLNVFADFDFSDLKPCKSFASFQKSRNVIKSNNSNIFEDFDLSDINKTEPFVSFQSSRNVIKSEQKGDKNSSKVSILEEYQTMSDTDLIEKDINSRVFSKSETSSDLPITATDLPLNPSDVNSKANKVIDCFKDIDLSDIKHLTQSFTHFESAKKGFNTLDKQISKKSDDSSIAISDLLAYPSFSIEEKVRKNVISNVFENLDLSDVIFDETKPSFRNARIASRPTPPPNILCNTDIDWNEFKDIFDESFGESQNFMTSSPKPKKEMTKHKHNSQRSKEWDLSLASDEEFSAFANKIVETMNLRNSDKQEDTHDIKPECSTEQSRDDYQNPEDKKSSSFTLRTDYETFNESSSDIFLSQWNDSEKEENDFDVRNFKGFCSGSGRPLIVTEEQLIRARLVFKDIEEWLMNEITNNKIENNDRNENLYNYSQKFVSYPRNSENKPIEDSDQTDVQMGSSTRHNS